MSKTTSLILILLAFGLYYTFTSVQYAEMKDKMALASDYQNVLQNVATIAETRDKLLVNYNAIPKSQVDRLAKILPNNVDTVNLAVNLDSIAARYGISIRNIQIEKGDSSQVIVLPQYSAPYDKVTVSFSLVSNYSNFLKFLTDLERDLRIMDVRSATFKVTDTGLYEYRLTVDTYWLKN